MSWTYDKPGRDQEKRREARRSIRLPCIVYIPQSRLRLSATTLNLSQSGASLKCDGTSEIPDEFVLFLNGNEAMRRDCTVVRRSPTELGVRFRYR